MTIEGVKSVGVVGAGVMGAGVANVAAAAGYTVVLYDVNDEAVGKGMRSIEKFTQSSVDKGKSTVEDRAALLARIACVTDLRAVKADLIIEAAPERLDLKREIFATLESENAPDAVLATNTSSISVTQIAAGLQRPERFLGLHFFNPAQLMKLVEVIAGARTAPEVVELGVAFCNRIGKTPAQVVDAPGFIVNRVARFFYLESLKVLEDGVADVPTIDAIMKNAGFRMGPFELMDLIGVDTNHAVTCSIYDGFFQEPRFRPSRLQQQKVDAGLWGRKSGKGFYDYQT